MDDTGRLEAWAAEGLSPPGNSPLWMFTQSHEDDDQTGGRSAEVRAIL
jgi:hypothetical protein